MDLRPYLSKSQNLKQDAFFDEALTTMSYNEELMAIPRDISDVVIYYNKDLFDQYGVPYPAENWTFEDYLQTAKSLTKDTNNDGRINIFGSSFENLVLYYLPFAWSNGGNLFTNDKQSFALDQPEACQGLQFYADLRNKHHVAPRAAEAGNNTMAQLFMQERVAMFISGRWNVPRFREDIKFNWDIARFPAGDAGSIVGIDGSGWAISKKSQHPDAAWKLIEYLASEESISRFTQTGLIVPARKDVAYSDIFLHPALPPESAEIFLTIIDEGKPTPQIERWNEVVDLINLSLEPVWNGNTNACKAMKGIKENVEKLLY
jgi:multiple sugar transport system substrate-binding protein